MTTAFRDVLCDTLPKEITSCPLAERRPYLVCPVLNENAWVTCDSNRLMRRNRDDCITVNTNARKRGRTAEDGACPMDVQEKEEEEENGTGEGAKRSQPAPQATTAPQEDAHESLPEGTCMVYCYADDCDPIKLNSTVEIIGVLSAPPELAAPHLEQRAGQEDMDDEMLVIFPPASKIPRLHAVSIRNSGEEFGFSNEPNIDREPLDSSCCRRHLLEMIAHCVAGDELAAEYILLQLIGRVHTRVDGVGAMGAPSLNLTNSSTEMVSALTSLMNTVVPRSLTVPLTVDALNAKPWWPRRQQSTQRLIPGQLQLAAGTQLLIDETGLVSGQLNQVGMKNLNTLQVLMRTQTVHYDFEFFSLPQHTDCPVTILSKSNSLLKDAVNFVVPVHFLAQKDVALQSVDVNAVRRYLQGARCLDFGIPESLGEEIEKELVNARKKNSEINEVTFHRWLTVARLLSLSYGERALTKERWHAALMLERKRLERLGGSQK